MMACKTAREASNPQDLGDAIPTIIEMFRSPNDILAAVCATSFRNLGAQAVPHLLNALDDRSLRKWTFAAIHELPRLSESKTDEVFEKLKSLAKDPDDEARSGSVSLMATLAQKHGLPAGLAIAAATEALRDPEEEVRATAAWAIGEIGDPSAVPALKKAARDKSEDVRTAVKEAISKLGAR